MTRRGAHYTSYFMFNQRALDDLCQKGEGVISYSRVVAMRGEDTPLVLCRQHREPFPPCSHCRARWYFPEQPVLVLRRDGRVNLSLKGGTMRDGTMIDTMMDALEL